MADLTNDIMAQIGFARAALDAIEKTVQPPAPPKPTLRIDRSVLDVASLPPPTVAGASVVDPVFGTKITRITTGTDGKSHRTQSSGNPWSADSKRFATIDTNGAVSIHSRDNVAQTPLRTLGLGTEVSFDRNLPQVVYGGGYTGPAGDIATLRCLGLDTGRVTDVVNMRDLVSDVDSHGRTYLSALSINSAGFAFIFGGTRQDTAIYAYSAPFTVPKGGIVLNAQKRIGCLLHSAVGDLTGQYVLLGPTQADISRTKVQVWVWDVWNDIVTPINISAGGHGAVGNGTWINNPDDADGMQYLMRMLAAPNSNIAELVNPLPKPPAFKMASHLSWCEATKTVISATYRYAEGVAAARREWDDEIIEVDPLQLSIPSIVQRWCHHRSIVSDGVDFEYWATPKPWVSPDGEAVIFTSNWNRGLGTDSEGHRQDVFMVERL